MRILRLNALGGRGELRPADVARAVEDLSLEVGLVDAIEIDEAERADTGRREVERGG